MERSMEKDLQSQVDVLSEQIKNLEKEIGQGLIQIKGMSDVKDNMQIELLNDYKQMVNRQMDEFKEIIKSNDKRNDLIVQSISEINIALKETNSNIKNIISGANKDLVNIDLKIQNNKDLIEENKIKIKQLVAQKGKWVDRAVSAALGGGVMIGLKLLIDKIFGVIG
jgi:hypothetical protein